MSFPAGTGISHTFIDDTDRGVRLLVVGETSKPENRIRYPRHEAYEKARADRWTDCPSRSLGAHDGKPRRRI